MIRYQHRIDLEKTRFDQWIIKTDRGNQYETQLVAGTGTPFTDWWSKQHQSELRRWQKDALFSEFSRTHGELELYLVYQRGGGYSQPHDIALAYCPNKRLWLLSTQDNTWIVPFTHFDRETGLGPIDQKDVRSEIYKVIDGI